MDFDFTEEHKVFRNAIHYFAQKEIAPLVEKAEEDEEFPLELFPKMGKLGYLGMRYSEKYGGAGADRIAECICMEEISKVCIGIASSLMANSSLGSSPIYDFGTEEQKQTYLVPTIKGEKICAFALTEPDAGSDVRNIRTTATKTDSGYLINGTKIFVTNGPIADNVLVVSYTDMEKGIKGMSLFIVDKGTPGFNCERKISKMGFRSAPVGELVFQDCFVPNKNLIGEENGGFEKVIDTIFQSRMLHAARSLGLARSAFDDAVKYAKQRVQFGRPIGKFQAVRFMLAEMALEIDAAELLVYRAAWLNDQKRNCIKETAMAKLFAGEMVVRVTNKALQIHGAHGYAKDLPIERYYRDAKLCTITEGTSEIQHILIARALRL